MSMQASTLRILEGAQFSTAQAVALGQAIDEEVRASQFVTVPMLDLRIAKIELQLAQLETRLSNKMIALGLSATGIIITAVFFIVLNLRR